MALQKEIITSTLRSLQGEEGFRIVETLLDNGEEAWWVGGTVRDMLSGIVPKDIDIATSALPEKVMQLFPKHDSSSAELGTVVILKKGHRFEITTFREDDEASDGRHPESVQFSTREKDALRRDFTVNAIYFHPVTREMYDPTGGEADAEEKLIRFIGEPAVRIQHDALRIFRAVRFRALINGQYHPNTYTALRELCGLVEPLSGMRKLQELEKMLKGPRPERALEDLWELGILPFVIPELYACKGVPQPADYHHEGDVWDHLLQCTASFTEEHEADVRLAALFHDIGKAETFSLKERIRFDEHAQVSAKTTKIILDRLQCPAKRRDKICWLIEHHMMMGSFFEMPEERKRHWYYHPWFPELLQLFWLDIAGTTPSEFGLYSTIVQDQNAFLDAHPRPEKALLTGEEVMELLGIAPGEKVGECLKLLHQAQHEKKVSTKKEAQEFLKAAYKA